MTQNPYPGPPPGWAPQPQYQAPPPPPSGYPQGPAQYVYPGGQPDPGYPPAPAYGTPPPPPAQAGPPPPAGGDPFDNPGPPQGGGDAPGMHQLGGRLLLIRPTSIEKNAPGYQGGRPGDLIRADVIVCDGEPIAGSINGVTEQFSPFAAGPKVAPFYIAQMYIRGAVMPGQLEPYVAGRGQVLGRVIKGQPPKEGKPPWLLADPTEQDKVTGRQIHAQWDAIVAAGAPPRPDQFGPPQAAQQGPPPGWAAQNPYGAPPAQPPYQQAPAYGTPPQGPPPGYGPPPAQQWPGEGQPPQGYPPYPQQGPPPGQYPPYPQQ